MSNNQVNDLVIENATIMFRNFSGEKGQYNPAGKRNFCVRIDDPKLAAQLKTDGWNIKELQPRDPEDDILHYLQVKVSYEVRPPRIYLVSNKKILLDEESVNSLDYADIENVDLVIRPYSYDVQGRVGISAYVSTMYVKIVQDQFANKYQEYDEVSKSIVEDSNDDDLPF